MAMGGKAKSAILTPRKSRRAMGITASQMPAATAMALPIRNPAVEA